MLLCQDLLLPGGICCGKITAKLMGNVSSDVAPCASKFTVSQVTASALISFRRQAHQQHLLTNDSCLVQAVVWSEWSLLLCSSDLCRHQRSGLWQQRLSDCSHHCEWCPAHSHHHHSVHCGQSWRRVLLVSGSALGFAAEIAVAIVFATSASNNAINLPYGASIASIVLVSMAYSSHPAPFAPIVLHALQRLVTKAYTGGCMVAYLGCVCMALGLCNSM